MIHLLTEILKKNPGLWSGLIMGILFLIIMLTCWALFKSKAMMINPENIVAHSYSEIPFLTHPFSFQELIPQ